MSKGMQQRLGIAQALVGSAAAAPDEPTSALDPVGRRIVRDLLTELRGRGVAVLQFASAERGRARVRSRDDPAGRRIVAGGTSAAGAAARGGGRDRPRRARLPGRPPRRGSGAWPASWRRGGTRGGRLSSTLEEAYLEAVGAA